MLAHRFVVEVAMRAAEVRHPPWILALVCIAQFVVVLDLSVVNVALPTIATDLGFRDGEISLVATRSALTFGGLLLLGGRLADLCGHRRVLTAGLTVFVTASLLGGLATNPALLVGARAGQGIGAAILAPTTLTILTTTFPQGPRRTHALVVYGAVGSIGGAAGNVLGGLITQSLSWRWILLINVPIGAAAVVLAGRTLPALEAGSRRRPRLDVPGASLATIGVAALTWGVTRAEAALWSAPSSYLSLTLGAVALTAFVIVETRLAPVPLIPFRLFRVRTVALGNFIVLLAGACFQIPMWYFLSFYFQDVLHYTPLQTGLAFLPHTLLGIGLGLRLTPFLMRHYSPRTLVAVGALVDLVAFTWQSRITADSTYLTGVLGPAIVLSIGGAFFFTPITSLVMTGVRHHDTGAVSGIMSTAEHADVADYSRAFLAIAGILAVIAALAILVPPTSHAPPATDSTPRSGDPRAT
jgi:EmrB/QacA subfamily drug resistance transporter